MAPPPRLLLQLERDRVLPGDTIRGALHVACAERTPCSHVRVRLEGHAFACRADQKPRPAAFLSGADVEDVPFEPPRGAFEAGRLVTIPFELPVPDDAPLSVAKYRLFDRESFLAEEQARNSFQVEVKYRLEAALMGCRATTTSAEASVSVVAGPAPAAGGPVEAAVERPVLRFWCLRAGSVRLRALLEAGSFTLGDTAPVQVDVDASALTVPVTRIRVALARLSTLWREPGDEEPFLEQHRHELRRREYAGVAAGQLVQGRTCNFKLAMPPDVLWRPQCDGPQVRFEYVLEVSLGFLTGPRVAVRLPVCIRSRTEAPPAEAAALRPPDGWPGELPTAHADRAWIVEQAADILLEYGVVAAKMIAVAV